MSIIASILNQTEALQIHSKGIEIAGRNLANVNNPTYARQHAIVMDEGTVNTTSKFLDLGIELVEIRNVRNAVVDAQVVREKSETGSLEAKSQFLRTMEGILGEQVNRALDTADSIQSPESLLAPSGLTNAIDQLFNGFQEVAANPTDQSQKAILIERANILTDRFHKIDNGLSQLDTDIDAEIDSQVIEVNDIMDQIATLNNEITNYEIRNQRTALELRDSRQGKLEELAEFMSFETRQQSTSTGHLQVFVRDSGGSEVLLVDGPTFSNPVAYDGTNFSAGAMNVVLNEGSMAGLHSVRINELATLRTDLDDLASNLVAQVNAAYNPLSTVNEDFFDAANLTAATISIDSALTSATLKTSNTADAGANELAVAVADLANTDVTFTGFTGTFEGYINKITIDVAQAVYSNDIRLENQEVVQRMLLAERDSISGVNLDEEMADMIRFQRSFQASARVISTMDNLLNTIVNGLGNG